MAKRGHDAPPVSFYTTGTGKGVVEEHEVEGPQDMARSSEAIHE